MARPKKESKALNIKLQTDVAHLLDDYVDTTGLTKTAAVERILDNYLLQWKKERKQGKRDIL